MNWLTKRSKAYLYRRGASLLSIDTPRVKHSRGGFGQGLQNLLVRTGLRAPPPRPNYLGLGLAGGAAAGGLGLAGLAAAYPEDASMIYGNMVDQANDYMNMIGDTGRDEAFPTTEYGPVPIKSPPHRSSGASLLDREIENRDRTKGKANRSSGKGGNYGVLGDVGRQMSEIGQDAVRGATDLQAVDLFRNTENEALNIVDRMTGRKNPHASPKNARTRRRRSARSKWLPHEGNTYTPIRGDYGVPRLPLGRVAPNIRLPLTPQGTAATGALDLSTVRRN